MVTSVIGYYFTYLNVTDFSSFWFLGGSDTGLEPLYIISYYSQSIKIVKYFSQSSLLVKYTIFSTPLYVVPQYIVPVLTAYFLRVHITSQGGQH